MGEEFLLKILGSAGGTGIAIAAIWLVYQVVVKRRDGRIDQEAQPNPQNPSTNTNPRIAAITQPLDKSDYDGDKPVTMDLYEAQQTIFNQRLGNLQITLGDTNKRIDKLDFKLDKATTEMSGTVAQLKEAVAVLKDRTSR